MNRGVDQLVVVTHLDGHLRDFLLALGGRRDGSFEQSEDQDESAEESYDSEDAEESDETEDASSEEDSEGPSEE